MRQLKVFLGIEISFMKVYRPLSVFWFLSILLGGCSQPFIAINVNLNADSGTPPIPVNQFVRQTFIHGLGFDEMKAYSKDPNNVQVLLEMLQVPDCGKRPAEGPVCSNILTTLGFIGGKETIGALVAFLEGDNTIYFRDKIDAVKAIGLWINNNSVNLMKDGVDVKAVLEGLRTFIREPQIKTAARGKIFSRISHYGSREDIEEEKLSSILRSLKIKHVPLNPAQKKDLYRSAIIALAFAGGPPETGIFDNGLSGVIPAIRGDFSYYILPLIGKNNKDERIHETLIIAQQSEDSTEIHFREFMSEAIRAHERIRKVGLDCYFEEGKQAMNKKCKTKLDNLEDRGFLGFFRNLADS